MDYELDFRHDWRSRLAEHVADALSVLSRVESVCALILAGSNGRGDPWPLSDVDLLIVVDDAWTSEHQAELESDLLETETRWKSHGFAMGLDAGKLSFTRSEVERAVERSGRDVLDLLNDQRWYHSVDKGYCGRPVFDQGGVAQALVTWFNRTRFDPLVVEFRLNTQHRRALDSLEKVGAAIDRGNLLEGTRALAVGSGAIGAWLIERWGERQSFARSVTRLEHALRHHDQPELIARLRSLDNADDVAIVRRMGVAPDPIRYWHAQSLKARRHIGEAVTDIEDARDTLGVARHYELRKLLEPPYPAWLEVISDRSTLERKAAELSRLIDDVIVHGIS